MEGSHCSLALKCFQIASNDQNSAEGCEDDSDPQACYMQSSKASWYFLRSFTDFLLPTTKEKKNTRKKKVRIGYLHFLYDKFNFVSLLPFQFLLPIFTAHHSFFIKYHLC